MKRNRSFSRGPSAYRRKQSPSPPSGKAFLIVTEGEKTEPNYFKALCRRLHLSTIDVEIVHPEGTDPITLTDKAIELREVRKKNAQRGIAIAYDEVWVVFDLEKPHDERHKLALKAMGMKKAKGIQFATSNPAFEFWLLLHERYTTSPFSDCDELVRELKRHLPRYSKGQGPSPDFLEKMPIAVRHARRCRHHHKTCAGDGNPSTEVDHLACALNTATRESFRFDLD